MDHAPLPQPALSDIELLPVLQALADPVRLQLVAILDEEGSVSCGFVLKKLPLHHWKVLREAGVTTTTIRGRERWVTLRRDDMDQRFPGLIDLVIRN